MIRCFFRYVFTFLFAVFFVFAHDHSIAFATTYTYSTESDWLQGTTSSLLYGGVPAGLGLDTGALVGTFTSNIIDAGTSNTSWDTLFWEPLFPSLKELPTTGAESDYTNGNTDSSDMLSYWRLNEGSWSGSSGEVVDSVGSRSLTSHGASTISDGIFNRAGNFNGTTDFVSTTLVSTFGGTIGSFTAWVRPDGLTGGFRTITSVMEANTLNNHLTFGLSDVDNTVFLFWVASGTFNYLASANQIPNNEWSHIAWVSNGTGYTLYVNGVSTSTITYSGANDGSWYGDLGNFDQLLIGSTAPFGTTTIDEFFSGDIDETTIWNTVLSATDVQYIYLRGGSRVQWQVRSCDDVACGGEQFVGPDGTVNTFYDELFSEQNALPTQNLNIPDNQYFQFQGNFDRNFTSDLAVRILSLQINNSPASENMPGLTNTYSDLLGVYWERYGRATLWVCAGLLSIGLFGMLHEAWRHTTHVFRKY